MMLKKKNSDHRGPVPFQLPHIPRARRSTRRRGSGDKIVADNQICAIELLASLAGQLLQDTRSPSAFSNASEDEEKPLKAEPFDSMSSQDDVKQMICKRKKLGKSRDTNYTRDMNGVEKMENEGYFGNKRGPGPMILGRKPGFDAKLGRRDDDGKFLRYGGISSRFKIIRHSRNLVDRRVIRKSTTSKHWKASLKLKDHEPVKTRSGMHPFFRKRKVCFNNERSHWDFRYKRRKLYTANGVSSSILSRQGSFRAKDSHVKLSIKSFKIPELLVEVPQTATVGSLKRTVMEAITAILGGGLRVGLVLEGKKIRDDSRTLQQSGISSKDNIDTLGFTLEPSSVLIPQIAAPEEAPLLLTRSPNDSILDQTMSNPVSEPAPLMNDGNSSESNSSISDVLIEKTVPDDRALVPVPHNSPTPLSALPMNQKVQRADLAQRRTRRPFSVSEVEALVQAVEDLGTGRWRDVKMRAFETAGHRTYVDLKDKWKTLVHTASISPQQRRGEPVPQDLLDRVLSAHAFWTHCPSKHNGGNNLVLEIGSA